MVRKRKVTGVRGLTRTPAFILFTALLQIAANYLAAATALAWIASKAFFGLARAVPICC